jgi:PAS domain S-box-containing protein
MVINIPKLFRDKSKNPLTWKTILYIILFSSFFTIIASTFQLLQYYQEDVKLIHARMTLIQQSYLDSLSTSLWEVDKEQIITQLKGILSLNDIQFVSLQERTNELSFSMGEKSTKNIITQQFPLQHTLSESEKVFLGTLVVSATLEHVYQRTLDKLLLILGTQTVKTFFVVFGIFYIIHSLLTRHLITISQYAASIKLNSLDKPLILNRKLSENDQQDELDQVVNASNEMRLGLRQEIAEREQIETELRDSRNLFIAIFEQAAVGVAMSDSKTGGFHRINKRYCDIVGYSHEEMTATNYMQLTHPDDLQTDLDNMKQLVDAKIDSFSMEKRYFHKDGSIVWVNLTVSPMWDKGGRPDFHIAVIENITDRKQAAENKRASRAYLDKILNNIGDPVFVKDGQHRFTLVNDAFCSTLGLPRVEIIGKTLSENLPPNEQDHFLEIDRQVLTDGKENLCEELLTVKSGETLTVVTKKTRYVDENGDKFLIGVIRDITERKQAEKEYEKLAAQLNQAQKMEAIGTLAGGIAHDFNNILGAIIGYTEMARDDSPKGSTVANDLDKVLESSVRAVDLVKQILAFSRQSDIEFQYIQPASIVKEAINMLRPSLPATIKIIEDVDSATGHIFADPSQFSQIVMNLCTNAFHAMEEKGGRLSLSLREVALNNEDLMHEQTVTAGTFVQLSICDSGPGMTEEVKNKIFNPYFTTKEIGKGTGMGLSIVHGIVKGYGGFITCNSELGKGTDFQLFFPVLERAALHETEEVKNIPTGKERVLFIDDEEILAEMGKHMLERLGYHVTVRKSSLEALETFQNQPDQFDVVITDQTMPGMTGVDLARRMLQIRPDIPIILCTGYSSIISEEKAKSFGIREFALKPVGKSDIAMLIRKVLNGNQA